MRVSSTTADAIVFPATRLGDSRGRPEKLGSLQALGFGLDKPNELLDPVVRHYLSYIVALLGGVLRPAVRVGCQEAAGPPREGLGGSMYLLEVLSGPLDGKTWPFEREITIGRDDGQAEACLALDRYVSRLHATASHRRGWERFG